MNESEFRRLNRRRIDLIDKKFDSPDESLPPEEEAELERLQQQCGDYVDNKYPLDFSKLEELERKFRELGDRPDSSQ